MTIEQFEKLIKLLPKNPHKAFNIVQALLLQEKIKEMKEQFKKESPQKT